LTEKRTRDENLSQYLSVTQHQALALASTLINHIPTKSKESGFVLHESCKWRLRGRLWRDGTDLGDDQDSTLASWYNQRPYTLLPLHHQDVSHQPLYNLAPVGDLSRQRSHCIQSRYAIVVPWPLIITTPAESAVCYLLPPSSSSQYAHVWYLASAG
jgi:hypothetical protein